MSDNVTEQDATRVEWAVDLRTGLGCPALVLSEEVARQWVQSYVDHPEDMDPGEPMPVVVCRTVTHTPWREPVYRPGGTASTTEDRTD